MRLRFAPSPTGYIHAGNLRTALFNYLYARKHHGTFVLRLDDTDQSRSTEAFAEAIKEDLAWLGIVPDEVIKQSDRMARYDEVKQQLIDEGRLYPCFETPEALELRRKLLLAQGKPPVYDRGALKLSEDERKSLIASGKNPHWRFKLSDKTVMMNDAVRGKVEVDLTKVSDPIIQREDGTWLYILTSVIDDADLNIDAIVRGDDHVTNTLVQLDMFAALGAKSPQFAHHNLLVGADGSGLSKRKGDLALRVLRAEGYEAMAINTLVALIGTSEPVELKDSLDDLAAGFRFDMISRAPARFDVAELGRLNQKFVHALSYEDVLSRLNGLNLALTSEAWYVLRPNLNRFDDIVNLAKPLQADFLPPYLAEDGDLLMSALDTMPSEPWDATTWGSWMTALKPLTTRKGAGLFKPLRRALTGQDQGPELALFLPLLTPDMVKHRLLKAVKGH